MTRPRLVALAVLLALLVPTASRAVAEEEEIPLEAAVQAFLDGQGFHDLLDLAPSPAEVAPLLRERHEAASPGWRVRPHRDSDRTVRDYHLYVPASYDPAAAVPLLFHLHGGVSRPALLTEGEMAGYRDWWTEEAERRGFLVVFPLGEKGVEWWTEPRPRDLESIVRDIGQEFHLDRNRVFVTGFSDGGSGSFYLSLTHPTCFAGFIPLNGHPAVASRASKRNLFPVNHGMRPLYVVNTQDDTLYPARAILPYVSSMMKEGVSVRFTSYPGIGHRPDYRGEQDPLIADWIGATRRDPLPDRVVWQTADIDTGRCAWVTILELGETPEALALRDVNVMMPPGRVMLGIRIDDTHGGPGVKILSVTPDSVAAGFGLEAGDVITRIDAQPIPDLSVLMDVLGAKNHGDPVQVVWTRGGEESEADGRFPPFVPTPTYRRDRPSGRIEVVRDGNLVDVRQHGVARYALDLAPGAFDFASEIVVNTNGRESFRGKIEPALLTLLDSFDRDRDPDLLFFARLVIDLAPGDEDAKIEATAREFLAAHAARDAERTWNLGSGAMHGLWQDYRDRLAAPPTPRSEIEESFLARFRDVRPVPADGRALWALALESGALDKSAGEPGRAEVSRGGDMATAVFPGRAMQVVLQRSGDAWRVAGIGPSYMIARLSKSRSGRERLAFSYTDMTMKRRRRVAPPFVPGSHSFDLGLDDVSRRIVIEKDGRTSYHSRELAGEKLRARLLEFADFAREAPEPYVAKSALILTVDREAPWSFAWTILRIAGDPEVLFRDVRFVTWEGDRELCRAIAADLKPPPSSDEPVEKLPEVSIVARTGATEPGLLRGLGRLDLAGKRVRLDLEGALSTEDALRILVRLAAGDPAEIVLGAAADTPEAPRMVVDGKALSPSDEPAPLPIEVTLPLVFPAR